MNVVCKFKSEHSLTLNKNVFYAKHRSTFKFLKYQMSDKSFHSSECSSCFM